MIWLALAGSTKEVPKKLESILCKVMSFFLLEGRLNIKNLILNKNKVKEAFFCDQIAAFSAIKLVQ